MANTAAHTPGPWSGYEVPTSINVRAKDGAVCRLSISPGSVRVNEGRANAHLIAAAPDLLAALCLAYDFMQRFVAQTEPPTLIMPDGCKEPNEFTQAWDETSVALRSAIAKADPLNNLERQAPR